MSKLQFGKYKGDDIKTVPDDYLQWLISSSEATIKLAKDELERREACEDADLPTIAQLIKAGYRELAKKNHPDVGGSTEKMKEVNAAKSRLEDLVARYQ